ncbi:MAG: hypothetical protein KDC26_10445 [Armatimonadetes bacterium]|nr:hypothetical protein [Armatimonadota bacterium]
MSGLIEFEQDDLCRTAQQLALDWGFVPNERMPSGHCSHIFASDTQILKIPFQGEEQTSGLHASLFLSGNIGPKVYHSDPATGIQLMERMIPGTPLSESGLDDEQNMEIAMNLAAQFDPTWREGMIPLAQYIEQQTELSQKLLATTERKVFLHGDLHHFNVLKHGDRWMATDAKGICGDPAYEAIAFLRNPIPEVAKWANLDEILHRRIIRWAERFHLNPWRIWAWGIVDLEDENRPEDDPWAYVYRALRTLSFPAP